MDSRLRVLFFLIAGGLLAYYLSTSACRSSGPPGPPPAATWVPHDAPHQSFTLRSGGLRAKFSNYSGAIEYMELTNRQFRDPKSHAPLPLSTTPREERAWSL